MKRAGAYGRQRRYGLKVLVTGGCGIVGSPLVAELERRGHDVGADQPIMIRWATYAEQISHLKSVADQVIKRH